MKRADAGATQAWQPLTPPGVAAFATASFSRLTLVQSIFAAFAGISLTIFLASAWFPTLREATRNLPDVGYIRGGRLAWPGDSPTVLASSAWLGFTVDLHQDHAYRLPCDLQVEFSTESVRFLSLAGYADLPYPTGWVIVFNKAELGAWWDAWEPFLGAGAGLLTAGGLFLLWTVLAAVYAVPAGAVCRFVEHGLSYGAVWKVCCAAQMPGCLLLSFTLLLYGLRAVDLVEWLFAFGTHVVLGWIYIALAMFSLPGKTPGRRPKANPFRTR